MKYGYSERIAKKKAKVDEDFDYWYWLVSQLAFRYKQDSSNKNFLHIKKIFKFQMKYANNYYYQATRLGEFRELLNGWKSPKIG